jgi:16S rRNA C967 or C1407 C5-methylase (RsmB/RsmF family)/NOL1/NOP2/fmu family ribosome biogenesis protein
LRKDEEDNRMSMTLPAAFEARMLQLLGPEEYEKFRNAMETERSRGLRLNPLKMPGKEYAASCYLEYVRELLEQRGTQQEEGGSSDPVRKIQEIPWARPYGFSYPKELRPGKLSLHEAGLYYLQEPSAMSAAALADAQPGDKILDLCAAPGGKSTQLAGAMMGRGLLVSNEIQPARAKILSQNIERLGVRNAVVVNEMPEKLAERFASFFDKVVVDAPCSGEGMFRKEEQALTGWSEENVAHCAERQQAILDWAAAMVKPGGVLVYSTCTFAPAEDEETMAGFLRKHPEFTMEDLPGKLGKRMEEFGFDTGHPEWCTQKDSPADDGAGDCTAEKGTAGDADAGVRSAEEVRQELGKTVRLWPHRLNGEGHFAAVLQKEGILCRETVPEFCDFPGSEKRTKCGSGDSRKGKKGSREKRGGKGDSTLSCVILQLEEQALKAGVLKRFAENMGAGLVRFGDDVYLMPYREQIALGGLRVLRPGLQIAVFKKDRLEPAHALAMALHPEDALQTLDLPPRSPEAEAFFRGESLPCDPSLRGWVLVTAGGVSAGWCKAAGGMLKNHYPKGLRRSLSQ